MDTKGSKIPVVIHWFRKGLRLHDNPALVRAVEYAKQNKAVMRPVFILDSELPKGYRIGANRYRFLVDSLDDLDQSFKKLGGRLFVLRGKVDDMFEMCFKTWNVKLVTFENDTEPYSRARDTRFYKLAQKHEITFEGFWSHTLYEPSELIKKNNGQAPKTYQKFLDVMSKAGLPPKTLPKLTELPSTVADPLLPKSEYNPPTLSELNISAEELGPHLFPGGESEGLKRLEKSLSNRAYVENFAKPNTSPNSIKPSTTVLSPYIKFGCLSSRLFYEKLNEFKGTKTKPPVSLLGQLYWREFYYLIGTYTKNFTQMEGNSICKQIKWDNNETLFNAWKTGQTGYPYIDAIMTQLKTEGWIHHLARHSVACFLTRGDLWQHWEKGQDVFEEYLLDADVYLNAGNWMWLSASAFFHQYYRVYSPIKFGQKTDPHGEYIRKYVPKLAKFPPEYIYEPWRAPMSVQKAAGCLIGKDYPARVVDHETIVKVNLQKMNQAYSKDKKSDSETKANRSLSEMERSDDYTDEILQAGSSTNKRKVNNATTDSTSRSNPSKKRSIDMPASKLKQPSITDSLRRGKK